MSYLAFHLVFLLPPILILWLTQPSPLAGVGGRRGRYAIPIICLIAFSYTTPWDNYLVAREVWWYGPERVLATIGYVPVEEYAFFILQPILTGLFLYQYIARRPPIRRSTSMGAQYAGAAVWIVLSGIAAWLVFSGWDPGLYMGLILVWACPVLAGMWLYAGRLIWALRVPVAVGVGIPTLYLWVADAIAIHQGIWEISSTYTVGLRPFGLPVEEALFFLVTNILCVKGTLLFLFEEHRFIRDEPAPVPAGSSPARMN
jgi:lycopene cyclase domain-containing protein